MGILIVINNFLHDFAAGILLGNIALTLFIRNEIKEMPLLFRVLRKQLMISYLALILIVIGGTIRTILYGRFEWINEAGIAQTYVLIIKHFVLGGIAISGVYYQLKLKKNLRELCKNYTNIVTTEKGIGGKIKTVLKMDDEARSLP